MANENERYAKQATNNFEVRCAYFGAVLAAHEFASVAAQKAETLAQNLALWHARRTGRGERRAECVSEICECDR